MRTRKRRERLTVEFQALTKLDFPDMGPGDQARWVNRELSGNQRHAQIDINLARCLGLNPCRYVECPRLQVLNDGNPVNGQEHPLLRRIQPSLTVLTVLRDSVQDMP